MSTWTATDAFATTLTPTPTTSDDPDSAVQSAAAATPPSETPKTSEPSPEPDTPHVPKRGSGSFTTVEDASPVAGSGGKVYRYRVLVEDGSGVEPGFFASYVEKILSDSRSWIGGGDVSFQRVTSDKSADFLLHLATPQTVDRLCYPLQTNGYTSCRTGDKVVINLARWMLAVEEFNGDIEVYRGYVINHEIGHRIGYRHKRCPGDGQLAPVMQQQTLALNGCTINAWPYPARKQDAGPPA